MAPILYHDNDYANTNEKCIGHASGVPPVRRGSSVRRAFGWMVAAAVVAQTMHVVYPRVLSMVTQTVALGSPAADALSSLTSTTSAALTNPTVDQICPQQGAISPQHDAGARVLKALGKDYKTDAFRARAIDWHSGAVRIDTTVYDNMKSVGEDDRWKVFTPFHEYLVKAFPKVHATLNRTTPNTYGLFYSWKGSNPSLKPILLMAHQDVTPVDPKTIDDWAYPPYSGHYDGKRIWGRGAIDDKSGLMGILIAIETLLEEGFTPAREVVLSFGFDEEISGNHGAKYMAKELETLYGEDSFALILDEGGGYTEIFGGILAVPGITEKGFLNVQLTVNTPGGHSSVPPQHTSIGMLSQLIVHYEQNPPSVSLARGTPLYGLVQCFTRASGLPKQLKSAIVASADDDAALQQVEDVVFEQPSFRALAGTTQAVDIIQGGIKANALPEEVYAVVNHRIDTSSTVAKVQAHIVANLQTVSEGFNLSVAAFGKRLTDEGVRTFGSLNISDAWHSALEPALITPTDGKPYQLLAGTIKAVYAAHRAESLNGLADSNAAVGATQAQEVIVAPGMMSGNTDTRHYWALSKHILRYNHASGMGDSKEGVAGIHTVNESIVVDSFLEQVRFFATLILNADEADL